MSKEPYNLNLRKKMPTRAPPPLCLHAFRCAAVRSAFRLDSRHVETLRNKSWRKTMESIPGWDFRRELAKMRAAHARDAMVLERHAVTPIEATHIAWTPCVCPFFDEIEFMESFDNYEKNVIHGEYDSLVSVTNLRSYIWDNEKALNYSHGKDFTYSHDLPAWYEVTNGNYMASKELMLSHAYVLGEKPYLDIRSQKCKIDIDTTTDLKLARAFAQIDNK